MCDENRAEYCFTWKIINYSLCSRSEKELRSPVFIPDYFQGSKWYLTFKPLNKNKTSVSSFLYRSKEDLAGEEIVISFVIDLIDGDGKIILTQGSDTALHKFLKGTGLGWNVLLSVDDVSGKCFTWKRDILTLRCRMFITFKRHESAAITEIGTDKCSFQWKLKLSDCGATPQLKTFSVSDTSQYEISVTVPSGIIEIKVTKVLEDQSSSTFLRGNIFLLNQDKVKIPSLSLNQLFDFANVNACKFTSFLTKEQLEDDKQYLKNDYFTLLCEFSTTNGKESSEMLSCSSSFSSECNNVQTLLEDLSNLHTDMKHSDVKLQCGDTTLYAHKSLLAARSPVFSAMFDHDMMEKQSGIVNITEKDPETLKSFVQFLYTGRVDMRDYENASKLLMIANEYQVPSLEEACSVFLMSALTLENACEILELADVFNVQMLKNSALDYFAKHMKDISNLSQWTEFMEKEKNSKLSMEIITHLAKNYEISPKNY